MRRILVENARRKHRIKRGGEGRAAAGDQLGTVPVYGEPAPGVSSRWDGPCRGTGGLPAVRKERLGVKWPPGKSIRTELRGGPP
jgi:hypothetical protein